MRQKMISRRRVRRTCLCLALAAMSAGSSARASNAEFQDYFFDVCNSPTGTLASRCAETTDAEGNLSGDSESSLNPSQTLSTNAAAMEGARTRAKQARERADRLDEGAEEGVEAPRWGLLFNVRGAGEDQDREVDVDPERGYERDVYAVELGLDYRLSDSALIGFLVSYEESDLDYDQEASGRNFTPASTAGKIEADTYGITGFAAVQLSDRLFLDGAVGYGQGDTTFSRNSVFQESTRTTPQTNVRTRAEVDHDYFWGAITLGAAILQGAWNLDAYAGVNYTDSSTDGFRERDLSSSGLNMQFRKVSDESLIGLLGIQLQRVVSLSSGVLLPQLRVEYEHEFDDDPPAGAASYVLDLDQNLYRLQGNEPDRNYFSIGAGLAWVLPRGWMPFVDAEFLAGYDDLDRYRITAGLRKEL